MKNADRCTATYVQLDRVKAAIWSASVCPIHHLRRGAGMRSVRGVHICNLPKGHDGKHECRCGWAWLLGDLDCEVRKPHERVSGTTAPRRPCPRCHGHGYVSPCPTCIDPFGCDDCGKGNATCLRCHGAGTVPA